MEVRCLLAQLTLVWFGGAVYSSNICRKSDITITDPKVTVKSFTSSLDLTKDDILTSKMVVGCPKGYQMRVDYAWTYQTYEQPNGNTLIEVNCSQLYALDKTQICFQGCALPKVENVVITPLPSRSKTGPSYSEGETIRLQCGDDTILSTCKNSMWTNLSEYHCSYSNTSSKSLAIVLDTTTNMGEEIAQVYDIAQGIVDKLGKTDNAPNINYVLVPFNDPDFYPMLVTVNGSVLLHHLNMINQHGASGGKDCPELTLAAIQRAIKECYPGSEIFVFTDASSKEPERKDVIVEEATRKRIKVNFVLTGYCGDNQMEDQAIYHEISDATAGFMVTVAKSQIREMYSLIEGGLMRSEDVAHSLITVEDASSSVVQVPCDKRVHRMTISVSCSSVRIISLSDDKGNDVRYHHVSTLRDMMTIMLQPSTAEHVNVNISCNERGSAVVTATTLTDICFHYLLYHREVDDTLVIIDTVDIGGKVMVYVSFGAAVYDVEVVPIISNRGDNPTAMKKYLGGYMAEIAVPSFIFQLQFTARYSGQIVQRLSSPIVPRTGCSALPTPHAIPNTLLSSDKTSVRFECESECEALTHTRDLICDYGNWSEAPPTCVDAGYTCGDLEGPGNGTIMFENQIVYLVETAGCGQTAEVHCNTYFELKGERTVDCSPYGWSNTVNQCVATTEDAAEVTRVLGEWWMWVVISVTAVITISVMCTVICILVVKRGKRKRPLRLEYERDGRVTIPPEREALTVDEDLYEVVDSNGNYPHGCNGNYSSNNSSSCQPLCSESMMRNRPPMPPPLSSNSYGNLPNMPPNPLYSRAGNDYMPMSGDVRSTSMIYEEMSNQLPTTSADDYNAYDYATGHV